MDDRLADDTPVVVGMACRFAGADGTGAYWRRLLSADGALGPAARWPDAGDLTGGFLEGHDEFDARFFRISPNEARCMDPQQRLLLQNVQHAVDDAHLTAGDLRDLRCGVFTTGLPGDYRTVVARRPDVALSPHSFLGNAPSTLSGRVSYHYDITGPSVTLDSACSSSLAALNTALLTVRAGQCDAAIVGAVSVFSTPEVLQFAHHSRMSSPTGAARPFTDAADGFVPAEGVATLVVMRHGEARARGLRVHGAVLASGLNHNGTTNGLAAPSSRAQAGLMSDVQRRDGVDPARIAFVETHGTGTELGDPLELAGLKQVFGADLLLGAVKPLIGHTLVCSGLAGVIKVLLALRHRTIPPAVPAGEDVAYLDLAPFEVNREPRPWPEGRPLAAVSAFGFTGSNGHVVLRGPDPAPAAVTPRGDGRPLPFCLSAESRESLEELARRLRDIVVDLPAEHLWDLSQLLLRRPRREHTRVVVAAGRRQLAEALPAAASGPLDDDLRELVRLWEDRKTAEVRRNLAAPAELADVPLPDYPFRRQRHWVLDDTPKTAPESTTESTTETEQRAPETELAERLCGDLSTLLGFGDGEDRVRPGTRIAALGLDSLSAVQLLAPYREGPDPVRAAELFGFGTVADLARAIAARTVPRGPQLRWHEQGTGATVVLLPPMNADHRAWTQQVPGLLAAGRRVLIPAYPGHGDVPFDPARFTLEDLADEVAEAAGPDPADLVGWSLGGCVATLAALRHPGRVRSLTLVNTAARYGGDVFERTLDLRHELHRHAGLLDAVFDHGGDPAAAFTAAAPMDVLAAYFTALTEFDVTGRLPGVRAPCLVLRGGEDCVVDAESAALLTGIPGARVRELAGHGHYVPLTAGRAVNEALAGFWATAS